MWSPPSPDEKTEVEEEPCVQINVQDQKAIPFFTHESGPICIQGKRNAAYLLKYMAF